MVNHPHGSGHKRRISLVILEHNRKVLGILPTAAVVTTPEEPTRRGGRHKSLFIAGILACIGRRKSNDFERIMTPFSERF